MVITILAIGSRGDVQPLVALSLGLQAAGHKVCIATHAEFDGLVRFDGETWSHYLPGEVVLDIAIAPDRSIWYITDDRDTISLLR
jgi:UDP:flavonoid glycosyltransferase YjiC (YdhE family)